MKDAIEDPVCHMVVEATSLPLDFEGLHFAFCSAQCKERFQANPHLYIGFPGTRSPAQKGANVVKRRRMVLTEPLDTLQSEQVKRELLEMMGILSVCIEGNMLEIQYDLMQATADQIASKLAQTGARLGGGWIEGLKLAFINYLEEREIDSLEVNNTKGCH